MQVWRNGLRWTLALGFALGVAVPAFAQGITGTIQGTVKDAQGAVVPGATVTLTSESKGTISAPVVTNDKGDFVFPNLAADRYTIQVEMSSFRTLRRENVEVNPGSRITLGTLTIEVGGMTDVTTVKSVAPLVHTSSHRSTRPSMGCLALNEPIRSSRLRSSPARRACWRVACTRSRSPTALWPISSPTTYAIHVAWSNPRSRRREQCTGTGTTVHSPAPNSSPSSVDSTRGRSASLALTLYSNFQRFNSPLTTASEYAKEDTTPSRDDEQPEHVAPMGVGASHTTQESGSGDCSVSPKHPSHTSLPSLLHRTQNRGKRASAIHPSTLISLPVNSGHQPRSASCNQLHP